ncbi:M48 family metallopeptidase [Mesoplasma lactucae]|uniref:Metal-dependent hydrolase n=1 Tax=Mesoplasma lactucae ATCC 49193 TaxID=81460 RepID=A0A291IS58_9MOLU|nr:YgjP-like metallopeptidase domain-containing protein [Mesoplasma lactucae]ATG97584.1 metal-dependent hydrolase [Mesoplasma lactucae ATCC 49193]ATZ19957.1 zinc metalloprotease [Mesoplasma lactucae ATCC 49193]MCL8217092.1 hypothetical protein [Mesoplasma lactucae ATCC 49193]
MNQVQKLHVSVSGEKVEYFLKLNDNQKNIVMRVRNGEIHVSAPSKVKIAEIEAMIRQNYSKINKLKEKFARNNKYDLTTTKPWIKIFDEKVRVNIVDANINTKATKQGFEMKNYYDSNLQLKKLYTFLSKYYHNWFLSRAKMWAEKMNVEFDNLSIKNVVGKWGACYPKEKKLIFNIRLIHFPVEVIDSVIVHELSHLENPNHSKQFWNQVYKYKPDYKENTSALDNWGI